jgi:hypothetical protein
MATKSDQIRALAAQKVSTAEISNTPCGFEIPLHALSSLCELLKHVENVAIALVFANLSMLNLEIKPARYNIDELAAKR